MFCEQNEPDAVATCYSSVLHGPFALFPFLPLYVALQESQLGRHSKNLCSNALYDRLEEWIPTNGGMSFHFDLSTRVCNDLTLPQHSLFDHYQQRIQQYLKALDFRTLFIEELGWDNLGYQGKARLRKGPPRHSLPPLPLPYYGRASPASSSCGDSDPRLLVEPPKAQGRAIDRSARNEYNVS